MANLKEPKNSINRKYVNKLALHTSAWANVLRTTGIIGVKGWFISREVDPSKWNIEYMTGFFMNNFPV